MRGYLKLLVLNIIQEESSSGSEIVEKIEEKTGWQPSYGSIYPLLQDLEKQQFVTKEKDGKQKFYNITETGKQRISRDKDKEEIIDDLVKLNKLLHEVYGIDTELEVKILKRLKQGNPPFLNFHEEIEEWKGEMLRLVEDDLYEEEEEKIRIAFNEYMEKIRDIR